MLPSLSSPRQSPAKPMLTLKEKLARRRRARQGDTKKIEMPPVREQAPSAFYLHSTSSGASMGALSRANLMKHGINPMWLAPYQAKRREQTFRWEMESLTRTTEWRVFKAQIKQMEKKARRIHAQTQFFKWDELLKLRYLLKRVPNPCTVDHLYDKLARASPTGKIQEGRLLTVLQDAYGIDLRPDTSTTNIGGAVISPRKLTHSQRYRKHDKHRRDSWWARRTYPPTWKAKDKWPLPSSAAIRACVHSLYTSFASENDMKFMDYRELVCGLKLVFNPLVSAREMVVSWARVYASFGRVGGAEGSSLPSADFMRLWSLPCLSATQQEELRFQAEVALFQIRTKASSIDETVTVAQVREMLDGPVLGRYFQDSPLAEPPRVPFSILEHKLFHPSVQEHLYRKRKQVEVVYTGPEASAAFLGDVRGPVLVVKRQAFHNLKATFDPVKYADVPATEIQRMWRGVMPKKRWAQWKLEKLQYAHCQKVVRGFMARQRVKRIFAAREAAAVMFQRNWYAFLARKHVRRLIITKVRAEEKAIREQLRQLDRERQARAAIGIQAAWRGHVVYQHHKKLREDEKKGEEMLAAFEAQKAKELAVYKAGLVHQIKQESRAIAIQEDHDRRFRVEQEKFKWEKRWRRWNKEKKQAEEDERRYAGAEKAKVDAFVSLWTANEAKARSEAKAYVFIMVDGPIINKTLEPEKRKKQDALNTRVRLMMKDNKKKARAEKRTEYSAENALEDAKTQLAEMYEAEHIANTFMPIKNRAQAEFDKEMQNTVEARKKQKQAEYARKRTKALRYMEQMIKRRRARKETYRRFYRDYRKMYDPVSGRPYYLDTRLKTIVWHKPFLIREYEDLVLEDRWYIRWDTENNKFYYNPFSVKLSFDLPPNLAVCEECGERWANGRTEDGAYCHECMNEWDVPKHYTEIDGGKEDFANVNAMDDDAFNKKITALDPAPICAECEVTQSVWWCEECGDPFCEDCAASFHDRGRAATHTMVLWDDHLDPSGDVRDDFARRQRKIAKRLEARKEKQRAELLERRRKHQKQAVDDG